MKKFRILVLALLAGLSGAAQENYTIKMTLHMDGLPPEAAAFSDMEMVTYIKGDKLKSERSGLMGSSITLIEGDKLTSLNDQMGNKTGFTATREEIEAASKEEKNEKPKIEYTDEKKEIAGYECSKAIVTSTKDKKENKSIVWYTDKIKYENKGMSRSQGRNMLDLSDLKGYPLSMEMSDVINGNEMKFLINTSEVSTAKIDDSVFTLNTEGYKMMSYKEMMEMMKTRQGMR